MKQEIYLCKADWTILQEEIPDTKIQIVKRYYPFEISEIFWDEEAMKLERALSDSLPQTVYDRLLIKMMKKKVSLYQGIVR